MSDAERWRQLREQYMAPALEAADLDPDPVQQFDRWLRQARDAGVELPDVVTLATASADGMPSARMVVLRGYDERGFVFYTNADSEKGRELAANPRAALVFYWKELHRQVRISGAVARLSIAETDSYFASRPRDSQIAAAASPQSEPLADRAALERLFREAEQAAGDGPVARPAFWHGYRVAPDRFIFWQGRPNRLHDRFRYAPVAGGWTVQRLAP